jgi:cob(I)alamin adenosyltransferase
MGFVHVYTGNGKGKTTAAIGLATRFLGAGGNVILVQFLKGRASGEILFLETRTKTKIFRLSKDYGFTFSMDEETKKIVKEEHKNFLNSALKVVKSLKKTDKNLFILDECAGAISSQLLEEKKVLELIEMAKEQFELVLTGRDFSKEILDKADYISEIQSVRHPMDRGIDAREGIEY